MLDFLPGCDIVINFSLRPEINLIFSRNPVLFSINFSVRTSTWNSEKRLLKTCGSQDVP